MGAPTILMGGEVGMPAEAYNFYGRSALYYNGSPGDCYALSSGLR